MYHRQLYFYTSFYMNGILIFYLKCGQVKNTALITYAFDKTFPTDEFIFSALTNIYIVFKG